MTSKGSALPALDRFGNRIDPVVGYARGQILKSSYEETLRLSHARAVIRDRVRENGVSSIAIFTGNVREFPLCAEDLPLCEEWVGPALFESELSEVILDHLGGDPTRHTIAVVNRTSAGLIAAAVALAQGGRVVSYAPQGSRAHASIVRGAQLARADFIEVTDPEALGAALKASPVNLLIITSVTSALDIMPDDLIARGARLGKEAGACVVLDDAYGARLRPVIHGGPKSFAFDVDVAISNSDKAGLEGPRAGFMAGVPDLIGRVLAKAAEHGQEARAPIALGVLRALQRYTPALLADEIRAGAEIADLMRARLGDLVRETAIGPAIIEDDITSLALMRAGATSSALRIVPCEASSALGMIMLADSGMLTVNTSGQPGAKISLRLKPTSTAVRMVGGPQAVVQAVDQALTKLGAVVTDPLAAERLILGREPRNG